MKTNYSSSTLKLAGLALSLAFGGLTAQAQSGVWSSTAATGNWSDINNWNSGSGPIADGPGSVADFSQINLTANRTITLDSSRTNGSLLFSDTATAFFTQSLVPSGGAVLTLDNSGNPPVIAVTNATAGISVPIAGTAGLTKTGPAQLNLNATNTVTGGIAVLGGVGGVMLLNSAAIPGFTNVIFSSPNNLTLAGSFINLNEPANSGNTGQRFSNLVVNAGHSGMGHVRGANAKGFYFIDGVMSRSAGGTIDLPNWDTGRTLTYATNASFPVGIVLANGVAYVTGNGFGDWSGRLASDNTLGPSRGITYTASTATTLAGVADVAAAVTTTTLAANTGITALRDIRAQLTTINLAGFILTNGGTLVSGAVTAGNGLIITNGTLLPPPNQDVVFIQNGAGALTVAATIADNGSAAALTKSASGTLILAGNNTFSGTTYLNAGVIQVGNGGTSGTLGTSALVQGQAGGLNFNRSDSLTFGGTITGPVTLSQLGAGALTLTANSTFSGLTTISAGTLQLGNGGASGSISNSSSIANSGTLIINRSTPLTYLGNITGNGAIVNQGSGSLTLPAGINGTTASVANTGSGAIILNGTNNYGGNTTLSAGSLVLGPNASITNSPAIIVASGARLDASALTVGSLNLNGAALVKQGIYGGGVVTGSVVTAGSSIISPATNGTIGTLSFSNNLTLGGGQLNLDITSSAVLDQIIVGGSLALNSGTLAINVTGSPLPNGAYTLIKYPVGLLSGSINNMAVTFSQAGSIADLDDSVPGQIRLIVLSATPNNLVWQGNLDANWDTTTFNWLAGLVSTNYASHDNVTFDDSATTYNVSLTGVLKPSLVLVTNTTDYTFTPTVPGNRLAGGVTLVKDGSGQLTLLEANDYSGPTTIKAGTIVLGDNGANSGNLGLGNVTNNAALRFYNSDSQIVTAPISGSGSLTNDGSGTTILAGNNSYTGDTVINTGTLQIGLGGTSGTLGTGGVTNNDTLIINRGGSLAVNNSIAGTGKLIVNGSGTVTLGAAYAYLNNTYISNGVVKLGLANAIPSAATTAGSTGWLILDGGASSAGALDLNGFNQTVNALSGTSGTVIGVITNSTASVTTNVLTVLNGNGNQFKGAIKENAAGGKVQLVLRGSTELRLDANNTFSAGTLVGDTATISMFPGGNIGAGGITLSNGTTVKIYNNGGTAGGIGNNITIPDGEVGTINSTSVANGYSGLVTGGATSTNIITGAASASASSTKQYQSFLGTVQLAPSASLRFSATALNNGGDNTTFEIGTGAFLFSRNAGTISLGALTGDGTISQMSDTASTGTCTYNIGAKGINAAFAGTISSTSPKINAINKVGAGTQTFSGTLSYDGATTISAGTLALTGAAELDDSPTITVVTNATLDVTGITTLNLGGVKAQTLTGGGTVNGNISAPGSFVTTINFSGTNNGSFTVSGANTLVSPGAAAAATLTVTADATLNDQSVLAVSLNTTTAVGGGTNDLLKVGGNLSLAGGSGVVSVRPTFLGSPVLGQPYTLITYTGTLTGDTNNLVLDPSAFGFSHLGVAFSTNTPGAITMTVTANPANLVWQGYETNIWQAGVLTNWLNAGINTNFYQYDQVTFDDSASNFVVGINGTLLPSAVTVSNTANDYTFTNSSGSDLSGGTKLTKMGSGKLTLTAANSYTGGTTNSGGIIDISNIGTALGTGSLALNKGTFQSTNNGNLVIANPIISVAGSTNVIQANGTGNTRLSGNISGGSGQLEFASVNTKGLDLSGDNSGYSGAMKMDNAIIMRFLSATAGNMPSVNWDLGNVGASLGSKVDGTPVSYRLGALSSGVNATLNGHGSSAGGAGANVTWEIGALGLTTTFAGTITDGSQTSGANNTSIIKVGGGTLTLSGANTYTGNTTVSNGTLELAQSVVALATNSTVTIASGAFLKLTDGSVTNQVASLITNGVAAGNGLYSSANSAGRIIGSGYLRVGPAPTQPAVEPIQASYNPGDGKLVLTWNNAGWTLQSQTNSLSTGLNPAGWVNVTGATSPFTNTVTPANPTVFYRLMAP